MLKPGGAVHFHGLAAARPIEGSLALPGLASHVRHAATRDALVQAMRDAGLASVRFDHFGECGCLVANGVPLHEVKLVATKRAGACC